MSNRDENFCPCEIASCTGPQTLQLEILEKHGVEQIKVELKRICSGQNNTNVCLTWDNPAEEATTATNVVTAFGPPQFPVGGGFIPHYELTTILYFPYPPGSYVKVKLTGPGINQTATFIFSSTINLYPWTGPCP